MPLQTPYVVEVEGNRYGHYSTFEDALARYRALCERKPGRYVTIANLERVDLDWHDGLTDEEREAIDNVE